MILLVKYYNNKPDKLNNNALFMIIETFLLIICRLKPLLVFKQNLTLNKKVMLFTASPEIVADIFLFANVPAFKLVRN